MGAVRTVETTEALIEFWVECSGCGLRLNLLNATHTSDCWVWPLLAGHSELTKRRVATVEDDNIEIEAEELYDRFSGQREAMSQ